jgi:hypothetical protein
MSTTMYCEVIFMPRTIKSEKAKAILVATLMSTTGHSLIRVDHHTDWYASKDNSVEFYLMYSQGTYWREPWYDISPLDLKKLVSHPAAYILFILDQPDRYLVIPARTLSAHLSFTNPQAQDGRYMFNIDRKKKEFREIPGWKLGPYRNDLDLIPKASSVEQFV